MASKMASLASSEELVFESPALPEGLDLFCFTIYYLLYTYLLLQSLVSETIQPLYCIYVLLLHTEIINKYLF